MPLLTLAVAIPLIAAVAVAFVPARATSVPRIVALGAAGLRRHRIGLGDASIYPLLLAQAGVPDTERTTLLDHLCNRDLPALQADVDRLGLSDATRDMLLAPTTLRGGPEVLERATGMRSTTVAALLTRLDTAEGPVLGPRSVVVVDDASTLGNRDFARLSGHVERAAATLRLVGDPAQHSAVAAGGAWRHLIDRHPGDTPALTELRRQKGPEMAEVRMALTDYRQGRIAEALARLDQDERVVEANSPDELLDALVADWYVDRQLRVQDPSAAHSSMVAEHHVERAELNRRARAVLGAVGELDGPELEVAGVTFQQGDEVIARRQDRELRPAGGGRNSYVRNGTRGRVVEVNQRERVLVVDFEDR
ncbi:MAG: AAA family ATPase, partial [Actinobacteria bacterium]|nr:AAA family ATPase [Actinomycetota bacterium]